MPSVHVFEIGCFTTDSTRLLASELLGRILMHRLGQPWEQLFARIVLLGFGQRAGSLCWVVEQYQEQLLHLISLFPVVTHVSSKLLSRFLEIALMIRRWRPS